MYLPTFWKLQTEYKVFIYKKSLQWALPATLAVAWIGYHSFYNWTFTSIIPPPKGVKKREKVKI